MLQEIWADIKELLSDKIFGIFQIFLINAKGFVSEEIVLSGRDDIKRF